MIPDTVYQKPMKPFDKPLPVMGINVVHDTFWRDTAVNVGMTLLGKKW
jgi:hypothetical protein